MPSLFMERKETEHAISTAAIPFLVFLCNIFWL